MLPRLFLVSLILFWLELGVFLLVLPWISLWEHNYFLYHYPGLRPFLLNHYLRGALSGLGLVDLGVAAWYAARFRPTLERLRAQLARESAAPDALRSRTHGETPR